MVQHARRHRQEVKSSTTATLTRSSLDTTPTRIDHISVPSRKNDNDNNTDPNIFNNISHNSHNNHTTHPSILLDRYLSQYYPTNHTIINHNTSITDSTDINDYMQYSTTPEIVIANQDHYSFYEDFVASYDQPKSPLASSSFFDHECDNTPFVSSLHAYIAMQKQPSSQPEALPARLLTKDSSISATDYNKDGPPKLDRTMSDVYNDELYSPNFAYTSAPPTSGTTIAASPTNDVFTQRLQAANTQHLSAPVQTVVDTARGRSPFRQGSPLAPTSESFGEPQLRISSARESREKQKAENDRLALEAQFKRSSPQSHVSDNTISPKDALLEYKEEEDGPSAPLFPPLVPNGYRAIKTPQIKAEQSSASDVEETSSQQSFRSMATTRRDSSASSQTTSGRITFAPPSVPGSMAAPRQYPSIPQIRNEQSDASSAAPEFPSTLTSLESTSSEYVPDKAATTIAKPPGATADGGTYTCTYHGCTLRFETPAKLQKHKREGHRQAQQARARTSSESPESEEEGDTKNTTVASRNTQAGPHKCERINPSTGKPCNTIFSRPYDLTRHEDTIHNNRKQKVRCQYCTEEKTFSRNDALTRHMRVVHPDIDFPGGKPRRRGGGAD